ncbi:MAG: hypothetical protein A2103_05575 [Gammaproteobacteria bacterium GWF2_41_13]|nr:MAG: hypothetical protein A2103_05575 [Gammaproteobacteria bacterium GWF2_41_13]
MTDQPSLTLNLSHWHIVAHELTTPLSIIGFNADVIKKTLPLLMAACGSDQPHEKQKTLLTQIETAITMISDYDAICSAYISMVTMLLSPIEEIYTEFKLLSMATCVQQALDSLHFKYDLKSKENIINQVTDFQFSGNRSLVIHILFNLFRNADYFIRHAGRPGQLHLSSSEDDKFFYLHIKDTGAGIDETALPHVFEPYFTTRKDVRIGLGLHFCQRAMRMMQGEISIHSKKDEWTEVTLKFPKIVAAS